MTVQLAIALILGLAVVMSWARLWRWYGAARVTGQASVRRLVVLASLQPTCAGLLYLALFAPVMSDGGASLRVATAGTSRFAGTSQGAPLIVLPEAPRIAGGEAVPDLAMALRRHSDVTSIAILGSGLGPRDIDAARHLIVHFDPPPPSPGIVDIAPPPTVAPGSRFTIGGTLAGVSDPKVELLDPAGRITDSGTVDKDGHFLLAGTARSVGSVAFTVRILSGRRIVEQVAMPVWVAESARPRLLILAGAPGPEVKYLRRWADDAGFDVTTQMSAGGGITLGDAPIALDAASLRRFDVAIVDDRSWAGLRGPLLTAVRRGMGLVLHAEGAIDGATRSQWQALGFDLNGAGGIAPIALPKVQDKAIVQTRHGIGSIDTPVDMALPEDMAPDINRLGLAPGGANAVSLLQDAGGTKLASWRAIGAGRVALFTAIDSYGLTLTGRSDLYVDWWSALLGAVTRPAPISRMSTQTHWAGERMTLCGLARDGQVSMPDGAQADILAVAECGAFWPTQAGWHYLRSQGEIRPFYVQSDTALPVMRTARNVQTMALLQRKAFSPVVTPAAKLSPESPWIFWLAWLAVSALLWWLERSRFGQHTAVSRGITE